MKIRYFLASAIVLSLLTSNALASEIKSSILFDNSGILQIAATQPSVTITSPKNGDTVGSTVEVKWKLEKANKAAHVHFYVDGKNLGPKQGDYYTINDLKPGKHTIELKPATASHDEIGTSASITVTVK